MKEFTDKKVREVISDDTRKALSVKKAKISVVHSDKSKSIRYSRNNPKHQRYFLNGYDLLQYNVVVRPFIKRKHNIKTDYELDSLLYLFPIQFFTIYDFKKMPLRTMDISFKGLIEMGYLDISIQSKMKNQYEGRSVYTLSEKARKIVTEYYEYLSGRKTIKPDSYTNPFKNSNKTKVDKKREELMIKLKHDFNNWRNKFNDDFYD